MWLSVCFRPTDCGGSPRGQVETCTTLCGVFQSTTLQCALCTTKKEPTRVTQEGVNTGAFLFLLVFFFVPLSSCGAWFNFYREKEGCGRSFPSST